MSGSASRQHSSRRGEWDDGANAGGRGLTRATTRRHHRCGGAGNAGGSREAGGPQVKRRGVRIAGGRSVEEEISRAQRSLAAVSVQVDYKTTPHSWFLVADEEPPLCSTAGGASQQGDETRPI